MCETIQYEHYKKKSVQSFHIDFLVGVIHVKARRSCEQSWLQANTNQPADSRVSVKTSMAPTVSLSNKLAGMLLNG